MNPPSEPQVTRSASASPLAGECLQGVETHARRLPTLPAYRRWSVVACLLFACFSMAIEGLGQGRPPTINVHPANQFAQVGSEVTFSVEVAASLTPLTYQWMKNGVTLAGQTKSNLVVSILSPSDLGVSYSVKVRNSAGAVDSKPASPGPPFPRINHTASKLNDGRVLLTGGSVITDLYPATADLYDPRSGGWNSSGEVNQVREFHTATTLNNGKVLMAGGAKNGVPMNSVELYDPATNKWLTAAALKESRFFHTDTLLADGRVLVTGGTNVGFLATTEVYNPATGAWTNAGNLKQSRYVHTATRLADGKVLVVGGYNGVTLDTAELFDPTTGQWELLPSKLSKPRRRHTATLLSNGNVLLVGGVNDTDGELAATEIYDSSSRTWKPGGTNIAARRVHTATLLPDGKVMVAGGFNGKLSAPDNSLKSAELYDPTTDKWSSLPDLTVRRGTHTAILLCNGKVLIEGGGNVNESFARADPEFYQGPVTTCTEPTLSLQWSRTEAGVKLIVAGPAGRTASIESAPGLGGTPAWANLHSAVIPEAGFLEFTDPAGFGATVRFYRAVLP